MIYKTIYSGNLFHLTRRQQNSNEFDCVGNQELQSEVNREKT